MAGFYVVAGVCGLAVAVAEILSRYRDEPFKALVCWAGLGYLAFNVLLGVGAYGILHLADTVSASSKAIDNLKYAFYAGFGAMVIIRAKLFNLKLENGERVSIGPDFVVETFLSVMDRNIDRVRAYSRANLIQEAMADIDFMKVRIPMITLVTRSMQNLSEPEEAGLGQNVKQVEDANELGNQEKSYALGFMVLDLAGEGFFKRVFNKEERAKYMVDKGEPPG